MSAIKTRKSTQEKFSEIVTSMKSLYNLGSKGWWNLFAKSLNNKAKIISEDKIKPDTAANNQPRLTMEQRDTVIKSVSESLENGNAKLEVINYINDYYNKQFKKLGDMEKKAIKKELDRRSNKQNARKIVRSEGYIKIRVPRLI
jgi:hypothetical protein